MLKVLSKIFYFIKLRRKLKNEKRSNARPNLRATRYKFRPIHSARESGWKSYRLAEAKITRSEEQDSIRP